MRSLSYDLYVLILTSNFYFQHVTMTVVSITNQASSAASSAAASAATSGHTSSKLSQQSPFILHILSQ